MNLPTEKLYRLGRHKMFKCWKWSSIYPELIGFIIFIALFWSFVRGCMVAFEARPQLRTEQLR